MVLTQHEVVAKKLAQSQSKSDEIAIEYMRLCKESDTYPYDIFCSQPVESPIAIGRVYSLNEWEKKIAGVLAPMRTKAARTQGKKNMIQCAAGGTDKERQIEIDGLEAELLYGKMFNLFPCDQLQIKPRKAIDDYGDYCHHGYKHDVKQTRYHSGRMTLANWKQAEHVDFLSLFTGQDGTFTFRGFCTAKELSQESRFRCLPGRDKPQFILDQNELISLELVLQELNLQV